MSRQRECRRLVALPVMTVFAFVEVGRGTKLRLVLIAMAIRTALKFDLELSLFSFWNVALRAFERRVLALQRIQSRCVLLDRELGGLPPFHRVACGTFTAIRTFRKLSLVRVGFMAIHAFPENERLLEISIQMALPATN